MSAAALRPHLFGHLFASRPEGPDRSSLTATLFSVGLHATFAWLIVWASMTLQPAVHPTPADVVHPLVLTTPTVPSASRAPSGVGGSPGRSSAFTYELPAEPVIGIPEPGPATPQPDFAIGDAAPGGTAPGRTPGGDGEGVDATRGDGFRILSVMPALLNAPAVRQALERSYPPLLRDAGIGGLTLVWALLDEEGRVIRAEIKESSGHPALDDAALKIAPTMRFSPAMNRDQRVKVWVSVPVRFRAQ